MDVRGTCLLVRTASSGLAQANMYPKLKQTRIPNQGIHGASSERCMTEFTRLRIGVDRFGFVCMGSLRGDFTTGFSKFVVYECTEDAVVVAWEWNSLSGGGGKAIEENTTTASLNYTHTPPHTHRHHHHTPPPPPPPRKI